MKKTFSLGKIIGYSQFPCPHPIKRKIAEILKKAPGGISIPESLRSHKNKQITESRGETVVKPLHLGISRISPLGSLSYRRAERLLSEMQIKLGNLLVKGVKFYHAGILTAIAFHRLLASQI